MSEMIKYSVSILKESKITGDITEKDDILFEECIILLEESKDFFDNDEEFLLEYFNKHIEPLKYKNSYGEDVFVDIVKIIRSYELFDDLEFENFTEVYSRFIVGNVDDTADSIMKRYFD